MNNVDSSRNRRVHWWLVWAGLFVWVYPFLKLLRAIMNAFYPPSPSEMPVEILAVGLPLIWTLMAWQAQGQGRNNPQTSFGHQTRRWSRKAFFSAAFLFVVIVGAITKACAGQPSWRFIFICAMATPASMFISNFLLARSNITMRSSAQT